MRDRIAESLWFASDQVSLAEQQTDTPVVLYSGSTPEILPVTNSAPDQKSGAFRPQILNGRLRDKGEEPYDIRAQGRVPPLRLVLHPPAVGTGSMTMMMPVVRETLVGNALALKATYTRRNDDILRVVRAIPHGRVTTVDAISQFLAVSAHHVLFLLARRFEDRDEAAPWYRVLALRGAIGRPLFDVEGRSQADCLAAEGVVVGFRGRIGDFSVRYFEPSIANTGVIPHGR
jgi:alkylated DNA nucleotide flippase Atl1